MKTLLLTLLLVSSQAFAQAVEVRDNGDTGEKRAREYFQKRPKNEPQETYSRRPASEGAAPRYLALHVGSFFTSQAYKWGHSEQGDKGKLNVGLTYRLGEWVNSMDLAMRVDYTTYDFPEGQARKLGADLLFTFPDANSRFPLYFGAGIGPGFMIKQIADESILALDYSLVAGARFLNVIDTMGFMIETGLKNHIHLLSDGQFNGVFVNVGTVFTF
jgi:hypothetical protein